MAFRLDVVLSYQSFIKPHKLWELLDIDSYIFAIEPIRDGLRGGNIRSGEILQHLKSLPNEISMDLEFGNELSLLCPTIRFSHLSDWGFARLSIVDLDELIENRSQWLKNVFEHQGFIYARLYGSQYKRLQNMTSLQEYELAGIDHSQLPKKHNGLPFPVGEEIVDISNNPGRWEFRQGYEAAVTAEMWLGKRFFELTGLKREQLERSEFTIQTDNGITHLLAYPTPFDSAVGKQGEIQQKLWALLYGNEKNNYE